MSPSLIQAAMGVAEKLREAVSTSAYRGGEMQPSRRFTITLGVSSCPEDGDELMKLINIADRYLYLGKAQGKNQVAGVQDRLILPES